MATSATKPFFLNRKDIVLVMPAEPTPSQVLSLSTIDNDPDLEFLRHTIYVYSANHYDKRDEVSCNPALVLKQGLARALVYYHPLAGKLKRHGDGKFRITCNAEGVPFAEATADCTLDSLNYFDGIDAETSQLFKFDGPGPNEYGCHPLVLQVTNFSCGGFTVSMGLAHSVCDGFGAAQFFRAMCELARGKSEPCVKPVWERERLVGIPSQDEQFELSNMASLAKPPLVLASDLCHKFFDIDAESIKRLKMVAADEAKLEIGNASFTTFEILSAYVWRSRFRALKQDPDGKTILLFALGIRRLVNPPLPAGYYGNAVVPASVVLLGKDLNSMPLFKIADLIKKSKKIASEADYITRLIKFREAHRQEFAMLKTSGTTHLMTEWRQLKLVDEVDFGWNEPVNLIPIPLNMPRSANLNIILPATRVNPRMEGGIRLLVSLPGAAMTIFKQEIDALKLTGHVSADTS